MASTSIPTDDTLVFSPNNRIAKVQFNDTRSTPSVRAFTITNIRGSSYVLAWRVEYNGAAGEIDLLFHQLKEMMFPYTDMHASCDTLTNVLRSCEQLPRLRPHDDQLVSTC